MNFIQQLKKSQGAAVMKRQESIKAEYDSNMNFLQTPEGGQSRIGRQSIMGKFTSLTKFYEIQKLNLKTIFFRFRVPQSAIEASPSRGSAQTQLKGEYQPT